ncbi:MAG: CDP-alcohol phosphatidyltransferase family protein [Fluviicola sp.]|jgi:CDP-diacylglycerol--glycerol-3-phosphate 3-phosphatidyltransferase
MISIYNIKPKFQQLLRPVLERLHRWGVTANAITVWALILSSVCGTVFYFYPISAFYWIYPIVLFVRMALNALDGMMARTYNQQSKIGEVLNEIGDVLADVCLFLPLVVLPGIHPMAIVLFVVLGVINEFAGILGKALGGDRRYEGPMGKSDRAFVVGASLLILLFYPLAAAWLTYVFLGATALLILSTFVRLKKMLA